MSDCVRCGREITPDDWRFSVRKVDRGADGNWMTTDTGSVHLDCPRPEEGSAAIFVVLAGLVAGVILLALFSLVSAAEEAKWEPRIQGTYSTCEDEPRPAPCLPD